MIDIPTILVLSAQGYGNGRVPHDGSGTAEGIRIRDMMIANGNHTIKKVKNMTS